MASLVPKHRDFWTAATARFRTKFGVQRASDTNGYDTSWSPSEVQRITSIDNQNEIDLIGTDSFDRFVLGAAHTRPLRTPITFNLATSASEATQRFFVADQPYEIRGIVYQHDTADGVANTATITKEVAGQAPGTGVAVMTNTFNLNATANVNQNATLAARTQPGIFGAQEATISLNTGEMLSFKMASAVTSLAGVCLTVYALPQNSFAPAVYNFNANAGIATQSFYLANRPLTITGVQMVWATAATDTGAVTADVQIDTGTTAPGSGTTVLSAAQSVKGVINTVVSPALTATAANLAVPTGARISVKMTGTLTALAGLVIVVSFANQAVAFATTGQPVAGMLQPVFTLHAPGAGVNQAFFLADRDYEVYDVSGVWSHVGGTSSRATVTVDSPSTASGAGTSVLSDNTNAGLDTTATANTVVVGTLVVSKRTVFLPAGARLSIKYGGTVTNLADILLAVSLIPR